MTRRTSRVIRASRQAIYEACTDPAALAGWRAPGGMRARPRLRPARRPEDNEIGTRSALDHLARYFE